MQPTSTRNVPQEVLTAFGLTSPDGTRPTLKPLEGGQGTSVLVGEKAVLKPLGEAAQALDRSEAELIAQLCEALSAIGSEAYRVVRFLSCVDKGPQGAKYVVHGWTATAFLADLDVRDIYDFSAALGAPASVEKDARSRLPAIVRTSRAFHADVRAWVDAQAVTDNGFPAYVRSIIAGRDHTWAQADRLIWGEYNPYFDRLSEAEKSRIRQTGVAAGEIPPAVASTGVGAHMSLKGFASEALRIRVGLNLQPIYDTLLQIQRPLSAKDVEQRAQFVHGDLAGNIIFSLRGTHPPAVLDISPYWRQMEAAEGILAADFLIYFAATEKDLCLAFAPQGQIDGFQAQMIVKGLLFRLLSDSALRPDLGLAAQYHRATQIASALVNRE